MGWKEMYRGAVDRYGEEMSQEGLAQKKARQEMAAKFMEKQMEQELELELARKMRQEFGGDSSGGLRFSIKGNKPSLDTETPEAIDKRTTQEQFGTFFPSLARRERYAFQSGNTRPISTLGESFNTEEQRKTLTESLKGFSTNRKKHQEAVELAGMKRGNEKYENYLDALYEGRVDVRGRGSQFMTKVLSDAASKYHDFDATQYPIKLATRKDFTSGKTADNITSLNTAIYHLGNLQDVAQSLKNTKFRQYNSIKNWLSNEVGSPEVKRFLMDKTAVSGELANVFKRSGATDSEIENIRQALTSSDSPKQFMAVISEATSLLHGRLNALQDRWANVFGDNKPFRVLSPKAQSAIERISSPTENKLSSGSTLVNALLAEKQRRNRSR